VILSVVSVILSVGCVPLEPGHVGPRTVHRRTPWPADVPPALPRHGPKPRGKWVVMRPHSRTLRPFSNDLAVPPVPPDSPFVPCLRPRPTLQPSLFVDDGDDPDFRLPGWQAGINTRGSQADPHASGAVARDPTQDPTPMYASPPPLFAAETWVVWVMWARDIPCLPQHGCTSVEKKKGGAHSRILLSSTFVVIATLIRPHRAHVGHVCSHVARCLPFCWLFPQKHSRNAWHETYGSKQQASAFVNSNGTLASADGATPTQAHATACAGGHEHGLFAHRSWVCVKTASFGATRRCPPTPPPLSFLVADWSWTR